MSATTDLLNQVYWRVPHDLRRFAFRLVHRRSFRSLQRLRTTVTEDGYSLTSFDERRCIFVHIPKCAGVSVAKTLFGNLGGGHLTARKYQMVYGSREFSDYFKFTFVRNPWDRLVSGFFFLKGGGINEVDRRWAEEHFGAYSDFDSFVRGWVRPRNLERSWHFVPQHRYICGLPGRILVDFVGFYEHLAEDFRTIAERLGMRAVELRHDNRTTRQREDYRRYYTDETARIVADVYREDIHLFGYEFDNSSLGAQLARRSTGSHSSPPA